MPDIAHERFDRVNNIDSILKSIDKVLGAETPERAQQLNALKQKLTAFKDISGKKISVNSNSDVFALQASYSNASKQAYEASVKMAETIAKDIRQSPNKNWDYSDLASGLSNISVKLQHNRGFMPRLTQQMLENINDPEKLQSFRDEINGKTMDECLMNVGIMVVSNRKAERNQDEKMDANMPRLQPIKSDGILSEVRKAEINGKDYFVKTGELYRHNLSDNIKNEFHAEYKKMADAHSAKNNALDTEKTRKIDEMKAKINASKRKTEAQKQREINVQELKLNKKYADKTEKNKNDYYKKIEKYVNKVIKKYPDFRAYAMDKRLGIGTGDVFELDKRNEAGEFEKVKMAMTDNALRDQGAYMLAKILNMDCIVPTQIVMDEKSRYMSCMDGAKGRKAQECIFVDDDIAKRKMLQEGIPDDRIFDLRDPNLQKAFQELAVVDIIMGQKDRHTGNFYLHKESDGKIKISGIDNDFSFGEETLVFDSNTFTAMRNKKNMEIDENLGFSFGTLSTQLYDGLKILTPEMAEKIRNINTNDVANAMTGVIDTGDKGESRLAQVCVRTNQIKVFAQNTYYTAPNFSEATYYAAYEYDFVKEQNPSEKKEKSAPIYAVSEMSKICGSDSYIKEAAKKIDSSERKNAKISNKEEIERLNQRIKDKTQETIKNQAQNYMENTNKSSEPSLNRDISIAKGNYFTKDGPAFQPQASREKATINSLKAPSTQPVKSSGKSASNAITNKEPAKSSAKRAK